MTKYEALKLALEAFNNLAAWNDGEVGSHMDEPYSAKVAREAITAIKAALEAKEEPWEKFCDSNCVWTDHHPDCKLAQRTWVGLTDKEVTWLCNTAKSHEQTWGMFVRAIETKLKEKNT